MTVDFFLPSFFSLLTQPNFNWHPFFLFFNCNLYSFDCFLFILDPILIDLLFNFISLRLVLILFIAFIFLYPFLIKFNFQFHHLTFYFYIRLILIRLVAFFKKLYSSTLDWLWIELHYFFLCDDSNLMTPVTSIKC